MLTLSVGERRKPDKNFIENYDSIVPDITELANYNIGLQEAPEPKLPGEC